MKIITRNLKFHADGVDTDISIRIFWPIEDKRAWDCRWEIDWPNRQRANSGRGVDGVQALVNALQMVGAEIYCSEEYRSGKLTWGDDWIGFGFPVTNNLRDVLIGDDARYF